MQELISIIIPVLNEEKTIVDVLGHVNDLAGNKEIIVVDGGSIDQTPQLAEGLADKVCQTKAGRGHQMNYGASFAAGEILLFLHSDSWLEKGSLLAIAAALKDENIIGGSFSLKIDDDSWPLRFISWTSNLRAKYLNLIFGDQGIFVRRHIFEELGGYPEIELMEDWEFSKRLAKRGELIQLNHQIYTSARRWEEYGVWKTIWLMHKIKLLYVLGVKPEKLKKIYRDAR
ncbi:MAG: TIGR04283 family arsenosugar biosynthesis glycosyltransferase [Bacillota bacterium]